MCLGNLFVEHDPHLVGCSVENSLSILPTESISEDDVFLLGNEGACWAPPRVHPWQPHQDSRE